MKHRIVADILLGSLVVLNLPVVGLVVGACFALLFPVYGELLVYGFVLDRLYGSSLILDIEYYRALVITFLIVVLCQYLQPKIRFRNA